MEDKTTDDPAASADSMSVLARDKSPVNKLAHASGQSPTTEESAIPALPSAPSTSTNKPVPRTNVGEASATASEKQPSNIGPRPLEHERGAKLRAGTAGNVSIGYAQRDQWTQPPPPATSSSGTGIREDSGHEEQMDEPDGMRTPTGPTSGSQTPKRRPGSFAGPLTHPNGVSIFPELSTSEQEILSREALAEAEGSIVADTNEAGSVADNASDAGYESDNLTSASTSVESSIRDYMYENGRRYHRFREGVYNFPNDDVEQEREDMKHAMVKMLCNQKLHFAPLGGHPQEILDIGTGTGSWAIEMGDLYASANVLGVDLSPIQPEWVPPNVHFVVDDIESPWLYARNHFDYIHSRHTVMAIKDWPRLFRRAHEHLKPGGWIELQEVHHHPQSANDAAIPPTHHVVRYWSLINQGLAALGVNFHAAAGGHLADMMRDAGFVNVTERVFHIPLGSWARNRVLKTVGLYWRTILTDGLQAIALGPLTRGLNWNREEVEVFLVDVRKAYAENTAFMYMPMHIIYGQKPTTAY